MSKNVTLSANQKRSLAALLASKSITEAADRAKLTTKTLHRYLADPVFSAELAKREGMILDAGTRWLVSELGACIGTLREIRNDSEASPTDRRLAAVNMMGALQDLFKLRALAKFEERLSKLEEAIWRA